MALTGISLNAATSAGAGQAIGFDVPKSNIGMQIKTTGSPSSFQVRLEGTLDGSTWFTLLTVDDSQGLFNSVDKPVIGARASLISLIDGSSPTLTALLAAA